MLGEHPVQILFYNEFGPALFVLYLPLRIPGEALELAVDKTDYRALFHNYCCSTGILEQRTVPRLALPQCLLSPLAPGDVESRKRYPVGNTGRFKER